MITSIFTAEEAAAVKAAFARLIPQSDALAESVYRNLFAQAPYARSLFAPSMDEQYYKLIQMLGLMVEVVDDPERFAAECRASGERHRMYGARPAHYEVLAEALVAALREVASPSPEEEALWVRLYVGAATLMTEGG